MTFKIPRPTETGPAPRLYLPVKPGMTEALKVGQKATFKVTGEVVELSIRETEGKQHHEIVIELTSVEGEDDNEFSKMAEED